MSKAAYWVTSALFLLGAGAGTTASADVITDWNQKATALVTKHRTSAAAGGAHHRLHACCDVRCSEFDRPPLSALWVADSAPKDASKEAAAAAAASGVLLQLFPSGRG